MHLARHVQHVGEQSELQQGLGVKLLGLDVGLRLAEHMREVVEGIDEAGHAGLVHGDGHLKSPSARVGEMMRGFGPMPAQVQHRQVERHRLQCGTKEKRGANAPVTAGQV